jgi:hypothetical protein
MTVQTKKKAKPTKKAEPKAAPVVGEKALDKRINTLMNDPDLKDSDFVLWLKSRSAKKG